MKPFTWRMIRAKIAACWREDRGTAMAEYLVLMGILVPLACWLLHPDNGLYQVARAHYQLTVFLLTFPGP